MSYALLKSLHITSVIVWMAGMLLAPVIISAIDRLPKTARTTTATEARRWFRLLTDPAISLSWILGIWMMIITGYYHSRWMMAKLLLVVFISALHGMFSSQLRRLATVSRYKVPRWYVSLLPIQIIALLGVAILVIVKPF